MNREQKMAYRQSIFYGMDRCNECGAEKNHPCMNMDDCPMLHPCDGSNRSVRIEISTRHNGSRYNYYILKRVDKKELIFFTSPNRESAALELPKIKELCKKHGYVKAHEIYRVMREKVKTKFSDSVTTSSRNKRR